MLIGVSHNKHVVYYWWWRALNVVTGGVMVIRSLWGSECRGNVCGPIWARCRCIAHSLRSCLICHWFSLFKTWRSKGLLICVVAADVFILLLVPLKSIVFILVYFHVVTFLLSLHGYRICFQSFVNHYRNFRFLVILADQQNRSIYITSFCLSISIWYLKYKIRNFRLWLQYETYFT